MASLIPRVAPPMHACLYVGLPTILGVRLVSCAGTTPLQLLIFKLALQLLRLDQLAHRLVEVVLVDGISVVLDGE